MQVKIPIIQVDNCVSRFIAIQLQTILAVLWYAKPMNSETLTTINSIAKAIIPDVLYT